MNPEKTRKWAENEKEWIGMKNWGFKFCCPFQWEGQMANAPFGQGRKCQFYKMANLGKGILFLDEIEYKNRKWRKIKWTKMKWMNGLFPSKCVNQICWSN
jgi:hypothetical protein